MTHHITSKSLLDKIQSSRRTFENTRCSWCQTEANYWTSIGEENFISIQDKTLDGNQAFAVFCPECLKDESRKNEIKYAVTIGDAEDSVPAQVQFRDLQTKGQETSTGSLTGEDVKGIGTTGGGVVNAEGEVIKGEEPVQPITPGPKETGVPAEEATGSGTVETRATENVSEEKKDKENKGILGKVFKKE